MVGDRRAMRTVHRGPSGARGGGGAPAKATATVLERVSIHYSDSICLPISNPATKHCRRQRKGKAKARQERTSFGFLLCLLSETSYSFIC
jgi:hypothetical protein